MMEFTPVYAHSWAIAASRGEQAQYNASREENISCCKQIEHALSVLSHTVGCDTYAELFKDTVKKLLLQFGVRRTAYVLATSLCSKRWSTDISQKNMEWAESCCAPFDEDDKGHDRNGAFVVERLECVYLDAVADQIRPIHQLSLHADVPVYRHNWAYASSWGDEAAYRNSMKANVACKEFIEETIHNCYSGYCLDTDSALSIVADVFSLPRVTYVLANTIQAKDWDGRISQQNKVWAKTITIGQAETVKPSDHVRFIVDKVNPGLTDMLATKVRKNHLACSAGISG